MKRFSRRILLRAGIEPLRLHFSSLGTRGCRVHHWCRRKQCPQVERWPGVFPYGLRLRTFRNLTFTGSNKNALWAWSGVINVDHVVFECDYGAGCTGDNGWAVNTVGHYGGKMTGGKTAKFKFSGPAITSNSPCCEPAWNPAGPHPYCTRTWDCPKTY